eukprot:6129633-Amphidinium_carterae.2
MRTLIPFLATQPTHYYELVYLGSHLCKQKTLPYTKRFAVYKSARCFGWLGCPACRFDRLSALRPAGFGSVDGFELSGRAVPVKRMQAAQTPITTTLASIHSAESGQR